jgi:hypothetical protein
MYHDTALSKRSLSASLQWERGGEFLQASV